MADEKNTEPTPGSDPSSRHEPDAVDPTDAVEPGSSGAPGELSDPADVGAVRDEAAEAAAQAEADAEDREAAADGEDREAAADGEDREESDEPALVGAGGVSRRPVRRQAETGDEAGRKGRATRRRSEAEAAQDTSRTGPVTFVNESVGELRKVVWPTAEQMRTYFVVVLVFVVFMIAVVSLLDLLFGWALLQVFR